MGKGLPNQPPSPFHLFPPKILFLFLCPHPHDRVSWTLIFRGSIIISKVKFLYIFKIYRLLSQSHVGGI